MIKRTLSRWQPIALLLSVLMVATACGGAASPATGPDPLKPRTSIKVGYLNVMDDAQAMLAKDAGFYEKHGLDVELVMFSSGTDLIKQIIGGQLQAGVLGFTNAVTWVEKGADLKVVGGAQMGYHSILVRQGSGIKKVEDLKGKKLASQGKGSTADIVLNGATFAQANLARQDVTMVYVDPAVAIQSLAAGTVDAAFVFEPYEQIAKATSNVDTIYEIGKVWPFPCMVVITSGKQLETDRAAINSLLDAQKEAMLMMQKNPAEAAKHLVKRFVAEDELSGPNGKTKGVTVVQKAIETQMFHWDISDHDIKRMAEIIDIMLAQGLIKEKVEVNKFLDLTWQQKAGK
jgi:NitT/TauT family transport system substrate-binding protein